MKASLWKDPNHIILHVVTNELILDRTSQDIATSVVNLACSIKGEHCDVSISNIILRTDNKKFNQKCQEVITHLENMSKLMNIYLIDNTNKVKAHHLNKDKLHLNKKGSNVLSSTFVNDLSSILTWQRDKNNTGFTVEECNSDETNVDQKVKDGKRVLKSSRCNNLKKLVLAYLNINFIRNKFELLSEQVRCNVAVLMFSKTKIDDSFPIGSFLIHGFSPPYRLDCHSKCGGIILYIREDIPSNLLATDKEPTESFYVELNLRNEKCLINCSYNPHKIMIKSHLATLSNFLDLRSSKYKKMLIFGDFNAGINESHMNSFCETYNLTNLMKQLTCHKNSDNLTCIDLILTNDPRT